MAISEDMFEELEEHIDFCIDNIRHPDCTLEESGRFYEDAAEHLRAHAILRILIDSNAKGFSNDLSMSAQARRAYLRRCRKVNQWSYFAALGRSGALIDAVAAGDFDLAKEVFQASPQDLRPGDEYEDDFCFNRFLGLCVSGADDDQLDAVLARYEAALDGESSPRFELCRIVRTRDTAAFEGAVLALLEARKGEIAAERLADSADPCVAIGCYVFVEGVAILKLARSRDLPVAFEYPQCPALALGENEPAKPLDEFSIP